jgi:aspartate kinase
MLSTPVIKFGGRTLQGQARFGDDVTDLMKRCCAAETPMQIYEMLAEARNAARARRLKEVAENFILPLHTQDQTPVVVVSAFDVATDKLEMLAANAAWVSDPTIPDAETAARKRIAAERAPGEFARLLMSGELRANSGLAMMLQMLHTRATSMTGREAGIVTRLAARRFGPSVDAMIQTVHEGRLLELIVSGVIPVVAGFQGYYADTTSGRDEVSVLGRGGSNLTAVALADALGQKDCTMFSDVDGVYDKNPRQFPDATRFDEIRARELFDISPFPNVIQQEAVAYAAFRGVDIWIRTGFDPNAPGTLILCRGEWDYIPDRYRDAVTGVSEEPSYDLDS